MFSSRHSAIAVSLAFVLATGAGCGGLIEGDLQRLDEVGNGKTGALGDYATGGGHTANPLDDIPLLPNGCPESRVIEGDVRVSSELELTALTGVTEITGDLYIARFEQTLNTSLGALSCLTKVGEVFDLMYLYNLKDVEGLSSLTTVGLRFVISGNEELEDLSGLRSLSKIDSLYISGNHSLKSLNGLDSLTEAGLLELYDTRIQNLDGLASLTKLGRLHVINNPELEETSGLASLTSVNGDLRILENSSLRSLNGFTSLKSVDRFIISTNPTLKNVSGFIALTTIQQDLVVDNNPSLQDLSGFEILREVEGSLSITSNGALPSCQAELLLEKIVTEAENPPSPVTLQGNDDTGICL